ncbi:MAG: hypothetical protein BroJett018_28330 [Chloroflexota bacterium]|nr:hypothetical protein [Chloroflexota bacterium]NOG63729.1 hypothetical protein [Chloroflexota bacterium]GIK65039.1 MAG: hypothetical protein BroJett018_28330 [Chloroflexota bacterium]
MKLEALLGHLFVVGGRSLSSKPPGALVQVAPRRAHRTRENDTLFVLITPAGQAQVSASFYENLAKVASENYFKSRVGVTGALREAFNAINAAIQEQNQKQATDYRAGALLMVKRGEEIFLARSGTTLCVSRQAGQYVTFPDDPDMINLMPLGSQTNPVLEFAHYALQANDMFVLGDAGLAVVTDEMLQKATGTGDINQVLEILEKAVQRQAFASVVQFVGPDGATAPAAPPQSVVTNATPETHPEAGSEAIPTAESVAPVEPTQSPDTAPMVSEIGPSSDTVGLEIGEEAPPPALSRSEPSIPSDTPAEESEQLGMSRTMVVTVLMLISNALAGIARATNAALDRILPEPEEGRRDGKVVPMNVVALIAIVVPTIIAIIVVGLVLSERDTTNFEQYRTDAVSAVEEARTFGQDTNSDPKTGLELWNIALTLTRRAYNEDPEDSEIREMLIEAQNNIDRYDRVRRIQITKLREFGENADLRGPIISANTVDIYTLDKARGAVFHDTLDTSGTNIIQERDIAVIQRGMRVREFTVANLVDIEWIGNDGGADQDNALAALDENGLLITYNPTFPPATGIQLVKPPTWNRPVAIALWRQNFYVLDAGANQVWRYEPIDGAYSEQPSEYFVGSERPNLTGAVDFAIDDQGSIYILFGDGSLEKYRGGQPETFDWFNAPVDGFTNGRALFIDNNPISYSLYVVDRVHQGVYKVSFGGEVNDGYKPANQLNAFDNLTGVAVDSSRGYARMYVLSGNSLYLISP